MPNKICFVVPGFNNGGGIERVTSQISNRLSQKGYNVSILSFGKGLNPVFCVDKKISLYELDCEWVSLKHISSLNPARKIWNIAKRVLSEIRMSQKLKKELKRLDPDIVVVSDIAHYSKVEQSRKALHFKAIAWELFCLEMRQSYFINYSRRLATKHAFKIVVQGESDCKAYKAKYPKANNIISIYNASSFEITNNVNMENKVVISAGRYSFEKGFDLLIEAWRKIYIEIPDWELRIFGDGVERENLQALIDTYEIHNIRLCGFTGTLDEEMDKASIYALPSRFEGFGMVLVEAQSRGLPIISFDIKHGPDLIIDNEINGFLIPAYDVDVFAEKVLKMIKDYDIRCRFSANSQKDLWRFDIKMIADQWGNLIQSALEDC